MITVVTEHPVALDSPDHLMPFGTRQDNSTNLSFNRRLYEWIPAERVRLLDLGCAGGGLVKSILDDGGFAVGIEGSDYSKVRQRAEWATIPGHLFTADITKPFEVRRSYHDHQFDVVFLPASFNVITAWEFLEHIAEPDLPAVVDNIRHHLKPNGFFLASIANFPDVQGGHTLHQTVRPKEWWIDRLGTLGLRHAWKIEDYFGDALVRGTQFSRAEFCSRSYAAVLADG